MTGWVNGYLSRRHLLIVLVIALLGLRLVEVAKVEVQNDYYEEQVRAAQIMNNALEVIRFERLTRHIPINKNLDPNETGVIGEEFTELTTSLGNLEAKRTSTNPAFAALMVKYLKEAGLEKGDLVAIGASGSFPALIIATLSAVKALELEPLLIYSIGASTYGANLPDFTFVEILSILNSHNVLSYEILALSPGGDNDRAEGMFFDWSQELIFSIAQRAGLPLIFEEQLEDSINKRLEIYNNNAMNRPIKGFVNIGGASANYGSTGASIAFPNGLVMNPPKISGSGEQGLVFEYSLQGVPVIHLLNIKDLALQNGLPIDPLPLPPVGMGRVYYTTSYIKSIIVTVLAVILVLLGKIKLFGVIRGKPSSVANNLKLL